MAILYSHIRVVFLLVHLQQVRETQEPGDDADSRRARAPGASPAAPAAHLREFGRVLRRRRRRRERRLRQRPRQRRRRCQPKCQRGERVPSASFDCQRLSGTVPPFRFLNEFPLAHPEVLEVRVGKQIMGCTGFVRSFFFLSNQSLRGAAKIRWMAANFSIFQS